MILFCLSCGCGRPHDQHNDRRHITQEDLRRAAEAAGISLETAAQNILKTLRGLVERKE